MELKKKTAIPERGWGAASLRNQYGLKGWWTSLAISDLKIIELYEQHGASEQFHRELKTDMDLERLPSVRKLAKMGVKTWGQ